MNFTLMGMDQGVEGALAKGGAAMALPTHRV